MIEKRFTLTNPKNNFQEMKCGIDDRGNTLTFNEVVDKLNRFQDLSIDDLKQIEQLKKENEELKQEMGDLGIAHAEEINKIEDKFDEEFLKLEKENEQLKQDNNTLIHLLENQSIIIQELHSKLLEYQIKEPIILTKEDLELMGKAISYYTHGRCIE